MESITKSIKFKSIGTQVALLHKALKLAGVTISGNDIQKKYFGPASRNALKQFQKKHNLEATGIIDDRTSKMLNDYLKKEEDATSPEKLSKYSIQGIITGKDDKPLVGLEVKAVDYDLDNYENRLGTTKTDKNGYYLINYTDKDFRKTKAERGGADIILRVYGISGKKSWGIRTI